MAQLKLSEELEKALLLAVIKGVSPVSLLAPEELSKEGRYVFNACSYLLRNGANCPLDGSAVFLAAVNLGGDREALRAYLRSLKAVTIGSDIAALGRAARSKEALVSIVNEAGEQLANGTFDAAKINHLVSQAGKQQASSLVPFASEVGDDFPTPPKGLKIRSLPTINKVTNGINGIWIVGGIPGLGKSTLSWQLAVDVAAEHPVIYYDLDGTGREWVIERTRRIVGGSLAEFKKATKLIYYRETIRNLEADLSNIKPPALIVIDSLQRLPTSINFRRSSLDKWLLDFTELARERKYTLLLVSEVGRGSYDEVSIGAFKESGEIEYTGAAAIQLFSKNPSDKTLPIEVHMTKNRHGEDKGHVVDLERDTKKVYWFREVENEW